MKSEINKGVYHGCIAVTLKFLLVAGEEAAKSTAREMAQTHRTPDLEDDFYNGAKSIAENFKKTEHKSSEIHPFIDLYVKFLKKYNPDFSKKTFLNRTFRGAAFNSKEINNLEQATKNISVYLARCLNGVAEYDWFN